MKAVDWPRVWPALLVATLAAQLATWVHLPLPWMLGPLFATALGRMCGWAVTVLPGSRQGGQWVIGTAIGLCFTPAVLAELLAHGWVVLGAALSAIAFGWVAAQAMQRWGQASPATAFFAGLPGGASEMVVLAQGQGAATDRIAAAHALRVLLVVGVVPFVLHHGPAGPATVPLVAPLPVNWVGFPAVLALSLLGVWVFDRCRIANAWILGPLAFVGVLTMSGHVWSGLPSGLVNAGQLCLGVALGARFSPTFFSAAPRFMALSAVATGLMLLLSAALALVLSLATGMPKAALWLAAAPGGMAEMGITARELGLSVPLVTAAHVVRVVLVTGLAPVLCRWYLQRYDRA